MESVRKGHSFASGGPRGWRQRFRVLGVVRVIGVIGFGVWGLGFRGYRVWGLGFRGWGI